MPPAFLALGYFLGRILWVCLFVFFTESGLDCNPPTCDLLHSLDHSCMPPYWLIC
jgi:hypothetical protein